MKKEVTRKIIVSYYWRVAKNYPKTGIVSAALYVVGAIIIANITPLVYREIIDAISEQDRSPALAHELFMLVLILAGLLFIVQIAFRIADFSQVYFSSNILRDLAYDAFVRLHKHSHAFFTDNFSGSLVTKAKRYVKSFDIIYDNFLYTFLWNGSQVVGVLVILSFLVPQIAIGYFAFLLVYIGIVVLFVRWKTPYDLAEASADSAVTGRYADTITNALAIKMFASLSREKRAFGEVTEEEEKRRRSAWNVDMIQVSVKSLLFAFLEVGVVGSGVYLWYRGDISVGTIVLLQAYVLATFNAMFQLGRALVNVTKAFSDAKEMVEIFEKEPDIQDSEHPEVCRIQAGAIRFDRVSFAYDTSSDRVFEDFSLSIESGEKIGLVGSSGAGKTTITKLLLRFADVSDGVITIDDQDIRAVSQNDVRKNISYVPQEPLLFHRSIRENIAYGNPEASQEKVESAAKRAHAHEFIMSLPKKYDTLVGERGVKLSGGERQRVAIARAMLKDAPILIFDEATSSLDSESEAYIQEALDELMKGRTVIVVAHRLSTIQKMDRILVLEKGSVVEEGSHEELLECRGRYATFWNRQAGGFLIEGGEA